MKQHFFVNFMVAYKLNSYHFLVFLYLHWSPLDDVRGEYAMNLIYYRLQYSEKTWQVIYFGHIVNLETFSVIYISCNQTFALFRLYQYINFNCSFIRFIIVYQWLSLCSKIDCLMTFGNSTLLCWMEVHLKSFSLDWDDNFIKVK